MRPVVTTTSSGDDGFASLKAKLSQLAGARVLVGIPEDETQRDEGTITNAALMYLHTNGSELQHIPPRPVIEPAIEADDNKALITSELGEAAKDILANRPLSQQDEHLDRAGVLASNAAKRWFTDPRNGWPPDAPATVAAKGSDRPLINTAQMRRAITHLVTKK